MTHRVSRLPFGLPLALSLALAAPTLAAPGGAPSEFVLPENLSLDDAVRLFRTHGYDLLIAVTTRYSPMLPDTQQADLEMQRSLYKLYARWFQSIDIRINATPKGIEMIQDTHLNP